MRMSPFPAPSSLLSKAGGGPTPGGLASAVERIARRGPVTALGLGLLLPACGPAGADGGTPSSSPPVGTVYTSVERFALEEGGRGEAERGLLFVPQVRGDPGSGLVALEFWRFPAEQGAPAGLPPVFELEGGPGFGGLDDRPHGGDGYYERWIRPFTRYTDYVSIGQRGFGPSRPDTRCGGSSSPFFDERRPEEERTREARAAAAACFRFWEEHGVRLEGFTVLEAADDVADVAAALGYDSIALWGVSFGSHWGMAVMRRHPELVSRAVLSGLEGPDHTYDMPSGVLEAVERWAAAADTALALRGRMPEGGLMAAVRETIARLDREPATVEVEIEGERDGGGAGAGTATRRTVRVDGDMVRDVVETGVTEPPDGEHQLASWAADMLALRRGDYTALARDAADEADAFTYLPAAAYFSYDCGSGISAARWAELSADPAVEVVGKQTWLYEAACPAWGVDLGEEFRTGFSTDVPTVLVQGTWDTNTPFRNAGELLPAFEAGRLIPVEHGTHGLVWLAFQDDAPEAARDLRERLIRFAVHGDTAGLPDRVVYPPPRWTRPGEEDRRR